MKKRNIIGIILILFFLIKIIDYIFFPQIQLKRGSIYYLNYGEKYKEPGYEVSLRGKKITSSLFIKGKINSKKIGNYKLTYRLKNTFLPISKTRVVKVRDLEAPDIKLDSYGDILFCSMLDNIEGNKNSLSYLRKRTQNKLSFFDTGYLDMILDPNHQVIDNYDGDITKKLKITKTNTYYKYEVEDSSYNKRTIIRNIKYQDKEKPVLTLEGEDYISLSLHENYQEPGYSAYDNCDKDINKKIEVSGNINTEKPGLYERNYTVKDQANNKDTKKRYVDVSKPLQNGTIYLTFDDGPRLETTSVILDILKEEGVKASFFVTNRGPDELIKREQEEGHTVALHTATHDYTYLYSSVDNYFRDLESVEQRVKKITGIDSKVIRFPGGSSNTISRKYQEGIMTYLTKEVLKRGYKYFDWNINSGDAGVTTEKEEVVRLVTSKLSNDKPNVVLMHDIKTHTKDALRDIIKYGKDNGYTFSNLTIEDDILVQQVKN